MKSARGFSLIEVLVGLVIMTIISLGAGSITRNVLLTARKSKAVTLAMNIENVFLETINNRTQAGYAPGSGPSGNVLNDLRQGNPVPSIPIIGRFGTSNIALVYNLKLHPAIPDDIFFDITGAAVTFDKPWVFKLQAAYKQLPVAAGNFQQYAVAYEISSNPLLFKLQSFGSKSDATGFKDPDFNFPLSQLLFAADPAGFTGTIGTCAIAPTQVISLYSVNLENGKTNCVVKGAECTDKQISLGMGAVVESNGDYSLNLNCFTVRKCDCSYIDAKDWVAVTLTPHVLYSPTSVIGSKCGTCEYVFKKKVSAQIPPPPGNSVAGDVVILPVCPKQNYDATQVQCNARINQITMRPSAASIAAGTCPGTDPVNAGDFYSNFTGSNSNPNNAVCDASSQNHFSFDGCYGWSFIVSVVSANCDLQSPLSNVRDAHVE
jgi:prepilin-type N-terminal cleavage/methylation domain-containing protein